MSTQEQANRTADLVLELNVMRRREKKLRALHVCSKVEYDYDKAKCVECDWEWPCETIQILDSTPEVETES